jgi:hypothetical protein
MDTIFRWASAIPRLPDIEVLCASTARSGSSVPPMTVAPAAFCIHRASSPRQFNYMNIVVWPIHLPFSLADASVAETSARSMGSRNISQIHRFPKHRPQPRPRVSQFSWTSNEVADLPPGIAKGRTSRSFGLAAHAHDDSRSLRPPTAGATSTTPQPRRTAPYRVIQDRALALRGSPRTGSRSISGPKRAARERFPGTPPDSSAHFRKRSLQRFEVGEHWTRPPGLKMREVHANLPPTEAISVIPSKTEGDSHSLGSVVTDTRGARSAVATSSHELPTLSRQREGFCNRRISVKTMIGTALTYCSSPGTFCHRLNGAPPKPADPAAAIELEWPRRNRRHMASRQQQ